MPTPDQPPRLHRLIHLGRALPPRTRKRVFEPAFYDLLARTLRSPQPNAFRFTTQSLAIYAGSCGVALRRTLLSRRVIATAAILLFLATMMLMLQSWFGEMYATSNY